MTNFRCMALVSLGIAFCIGCSDSSTQSWESKSQPSGQKKAPKLDETADNDDTSTAEQSDNPHGIDEPARRHADAGGGGETKLENNGKLDFDTVHFTVPKSWIRKSPRVRCLQAEYRHPQGRRRQGGRSSDREPGSAARWKTTSIAGRGNSASWTRKTRKPSMPAGSRSRSLISRARSTTRGPYDGGADGVPPRLPHAGRNLPAPQRGRTALHQVLRAEEDDRRPGRRNQGIPPFAQGGQIS